MIQDSGHCKLGDGVQMRVLGGIARMRVGVRVGFRMFEVELK